MFYFPHIFFSHTNFRSKFPSLIIANFYVSRSRPSCVFSFCIFIVCFFFIYICIFYFLLLSIISISNNIYYMCTLFSFSSRLLINSLRTTYMSPLHGTRESNLSTIEGSDVCKVKVKRVWKLKEKTKKNKKDQKRK